MSAPLDLEQFAGFTPGPWSCLTSGGTEVWNRYDVRHFSHQVHSRIASTRDADLHVMHDGNAKANARLIAAAPALLEECRRQRKEIARLRGALKWTLEHLAEPIHDGRGDGPTSSYATDYAYARAALQQTGAGA